MENIMAFMVPVADYMEGYEVDTAAGGGFVPLEILSSSELASIKHGRKQVLAQYVEGASSKSKVYSAKRVKGWFGRLSAPGYMDATEWMGPYKTANEALEAVKDFYEVDDEGNDLSDGGDID